MAGGCRRGIRSGVASCGLWDVGGVGLGDDVCGTGLAHVVGRECRGRWGIPCLVCKLLFLLCWTSMLGLFVSAIRVVSKHAPAAYPRLHFHNSIPVPPQSPCSPHAVLPSVSPSLLVRPLRHLNTLPANKQPRESTHH